MASSILLTIATFAGNFDHFLAGQIRRTFSIMAGGLALMGTVGSSGGTTLLANVSLRKALSLVTRLDALVAATWQRFGTRKPTAERALVTGYCFSLFVFTVAGLGGQDDTRWTVGIRVAVVQSRVRTQVPP